MHNLQEFNNSEFGNVRTLVINNEPYFVGKDIGDILGYDRPDKALEKHVDDDDKLMAQIGTSGQNRNMYVINESGLYSLILSSKLPNAKAFKRWVTSEVLPTIRKHGAYATEETLEQMITSPEFGIQLLTKLKEEKDKRQQVEAELEANRPKILFADAVETSSSSCLIGELAKILTQNGYEIGQNRLFKQLRTMGYLGTVGERYNIPNQRYIQQGLFEIKKRTLQEPNGSVRVTTTTKVTGKGQQYFINLFLGSK